MQKRRGKANGPCGITEHRRGRVDEPGDQWWFGVVPPLQRLTPTPVLGLIGIEFERRQKYAGETYNQKPDKNQGCKARGRVSVVYAVYHFECC